MDLSTYNLKIVFYLYYQMFESTNFFLLKFLYKYIIIIIRDQNISKPTVIIYFKSFDYRVDYKKHAKLK